MAAAVKMTRRIALVTCSTRSPRLNPFITSYVRSVVTSMPHSASANLSISVLDLNDQALPLYDEPEIPSHLPQANPTPSYANEHTRRWSATVRQYDAFIFVTPQYNWSIPASLKNALDYLFHEWTGKPAAIVAYGGRGGGKAAEHLRQILSGLRMQVVPSSTLLIVNGKTMDLCTESQDISPQDRDRWAHDGAEDTLNVAFGELVKALPA